MKMNILILSLFIMIFACKDLLWKYFFIIQFNVFVVLFFMGCGCLFISMLESFFKRKSIIPKDPKYQIQRLFITGGAWFFTVFSFNFLNAGTISILTKIITPLMIIIASLLGISYSKKQKNVSYFMVFIFALVAIFNRGTGDQVVGYFFLSLAISFVILEYIMLRNTSQKEGNNIVSLSPAIACILIGLAGFIFKAPNFQSFSLIETFLLLLNGVIMYFFYWLSIFRYKILPLGLSELPSLMATYVIILGEKYLFNVHHDYVYIIFLLIVTGLSLYVCSMKRIVQFPDKNIVS